MGNPSILATWARQEAALRVLRRVTEALEKASVRVLPVKGIVTARRLYSDIALRPMDDIDLRIAPRSFRRAVRVAEAQGWQPETNAPRLWEASLHVDHWVVEIECTLGPPGLCAVGVEDAIRRASHCVEPFGFPHLEPELHDHALILALNAFKDGLRPPPWAIEDLRRIVCHPAFEATKLVARARRGGVLAALWLVADWMSEKHFVPEWGLVKERIGSPRRRVTVVYRSLARGRRWPPKVGMIVAAFSNDSMWRSTVGAALAAAGVARRRLREPFSRRRSAPGRE